MLPKPRRNRGLLEDVDLEGGVLRVRRTLTRAKGRFFFGDPKTAKGRRGVRLTNLAIEALRAHLSGQLHEIDRLGSLYEDADSFSLRRGERSCTPPT